MSGDAQSSGAGGDATAPAGFSWSQVVRKDKQPSQADGGSATAASPMKEKGEESHHAKPHGQADEVAEKVGELKLFPAGGESSAEGAQAQAPPGPAGSADRKGSGEAPASAAAAAAGAGVGAEAGDSSSSAVVDAPLKPLKPAWATATAGGGDAGASGVKEGGPVGPESPAAVKVLSTSSQSWPTLGDAKTEPQKRGLSLEAQSHQNNAAGSNSGSGSGAKHHGGRGDLNSGGSRGPGYNKRGGGSGGANNNNNNNVNNGNSSKDPAANSNSQRGNGGGNPAGVSGNHGRRRQNGKSGSAPGQSSSGSGRDGGMNGWAGAGTGAGGNNKSYGGRHNRGGQTNQGGRGGNGRSNNAAGGAKGRQPQQQMNGQMANGAGGAMGQAAPFYMPMYYAPMPAAGPGGVGAPMYMMPPPQVNGQMAAAGQQGGAGGAGGASGGQQSKDSILGAVKVQVEYYFSVQNLVKDMFLRAKMDDEGWIPVGVIAAFNRVRALAPNPAMIAAALEGSALVEVSESQESSRVRESWQQWVLPKERRDASTSRRPQSSPGSPVPGMGMHSHGISMASMYPCTEVSDDMLDRLTLIGRLATGDVVKDSEALVMTNDVAAMVNNGIAVLESQLRSKQGSGGPDSANAANQAAGGAAAAGMGAEALPMVSNHFYPIAPMLAEQQPPRAKDQQQQMPLVAPSTFGSHVGWMFAPSGSGAAPAGQPAPVEGKAVRHEAIHEFGHPAQTYFKANNYVQIKYGDFRDCCLRKRAEQVAAAAPTTHTPEMYTLYQFLGLFLRDVFNASMYEEFKRCALADHEEGRGSFGVTCLFGLYHHRLLKEFRPVLFKDFENIAQQELKKGNQQVMMEFNAFCINTGINSNNKG